MNRTSRLFLMGSGFVLAAGLGTGLVAYYGGGLSTLASAAASVGPEELKYVPEAAAVVAYANVRDVMNSEFRQKIRTVLPDHDTKGQEEFQRETGINIEQDIDYVLAWMTPAPATAQTADAHDKGGRPVGLVLLHGRFDTARLEALATSHGGVVETIDGIRVLRPNPDKRARSGRSRSRRPQRPRPHRPPPQGRRRPDGGLPRARADCPRRGGRPSAPPSPTAPAAAAPSATTRTWPT